MSIPVQRAMLASQAKRQNSTRVLSFPVHGGTHGLLMVFNKYNFTSPGRRGLIKLPTDGSSMISTDSTGSVLLPIPATLVDNNSLRIVQNDLISLTSDFVASTVSGNFSEFVSEFTNSIGSASMTDAAMGLARKIFYDNDLTAAAGIGLGTTLNPKAALVFEGIDLKEFSFEWTLSPTEKAETEVLRDIVLEIKKNALPMYGQNATTSTRLMLGYPSTVDLYLLGVDPNYYIFFKTAMIRNVSVNYTPNGLAILKGGAPATVNLSIQLKEMDIHVAGDYDSSGEFGSASDFTPPPGNPEDDGPAPDAGSVPGN